jgi:hypothetical protein
MEGRECDVQDGMQVSKSKWIEGKECRIEGF